MLIMALIINVTERYIQSIQINFKPFPQKCDPGDIRLLSFITLTVTVNSCSIYLSSLGDRVEKKRMFTSVIVA